MVAKPGSLSGSAKSLVLDPDLNLNKCRSQLLVCEDKLKYSTIFTFSARKVHQKLLYTISPAGNIFRKSWKSQLLSLYINDLIFQELGLQPDPDCMCRTGTG